MITFVNMLENLVSDRGSIFSTKIVVNLVRYPGPSVTFRWPFTSIESILAKRKSIGRSNTLSMDGSNTPWEPGYLG
jgi:hypothetical protein